MTDEDPYAGWTSASVGCHWTRRLPDGRDIHLSTWISGDRSGYVLTLDYERRVFPDLDTAKAAYEFLASAPEDTSVMEAPGALTNS